MHLSRLLLAALALLAVRPAAAQFGPPADPCPLGSAERLLEGGNVRAALYTNGNLFFGETRTNGDGYFAPTRPDPARSPVFAASLWVGGRVGGEARTVSARYTGFQLRPGRTGPDGAAPGPTACADADRVWLASHGVADTDSLGLADLLTWPVALGAPVVDGDGVPGNYDLAAGDRPGVRGDATAFWAMTDTPAERRDGEAPLGVDVAVEASAVDQTVLDASTFYHLTVTNRNAVPIEDAYVGVWLDADLGNAADDFVGTDTTAHLAYVYNADDDDSVYGVPPAVGVVVLGGPLADANGRDDDRDGVVDEPGERLGLGAAPPMEKSFRGVFGEPNLAPHVYARLRGLWDEGHPVYAYGAGAIPPEGGAPTTVFAYPGDPVTGTPWSSENIDGEGTRSGPRDIRVLASVGPFDLAPGASAEVAYGVVFAQGDDRLDSVVRLRALARAARRAAEAGGLDRAALRTPIDFSLPEVPFTIRRPSPNPFGGATTLELRGLAEATVRVSVYDVLGRRVAGPEARSESGPVEIGAGLPAGVYLVRVEGTGFAQTFPVTKAR